MDWCPTCGNWDSWCQHPSTGITAVYGNYTIGTTISTTITVDRIWNAWQQTTITGSWCDGGINNSIRMTVTPSVVSDEEIGERRRQHEESRERRRRAEFAAEELLLSLLSPEQKAEYEETDAFTVVTSAGHRYRIDCGGAWTGNVSLRSEDGQSLANLCCHGAGALPRSDQFAHQLLALMADEAKFIGTANLHWSGYLPEWFIKMRADWREGRTNSTRNDYVGPVTVYEDAA